MNKKVVLITGCNGGIGKVICQKFLSKKWNVIGTDYIEKENKYINRFIKSDLVKKESPKKIFDNIMSKEKKLDCIVNVAAIQVCKSIVDSEYDDWDKVVNCNIRSIFFLAKFFHPLLKKSKGNIINIASVHSVCTSKNISIYAMSKAAVVGLTRNMAIEFGQDGIRVNSISPGAINTQMLREGIKRSFKDINKGLKKLADQHIMKRIGEPLEIANTVYFITKNEFMTGQNIVVDGGAIIKLSTE